MKSNVPFLKALNSSHPTTAGGLQAASHVFLHEIILPEFSYSRHVTTNAHGQ